MSHVVDKSWIHELASWKRKAQACRPVLRDGAEISHIINKTMLIVCFNAVCGKQVSPARG